MEWKPKFNSISNQDKVGSSSISKKEWNFIINSLSNQSNNNTVGIKLIKDIVDKIERTVQLNDSQMKQVEEIVREIILEEILEDIIKKSEILFYPTREDFPLVGKKENFYISKTKEGQEVSEIYYWDEQLNNYISISASSIEPPTAREIEMRTNETHIQWKYINEEVWNDLISLDSIKGEDGETPIVREVEMRSSGTHIQWRYVGDLLWNDLISVSDLEAKEIEMQKGITHLQWKYLDEVEWRNLIPIEDLKGEDGGGMTIETSEGIDGEPIDSNADFWIKY